MIYILDEFKNSYMRSINNWNTYQLEKIILLILEVGDIQSQGVEAIAQSLELNNTL